MDSRQDLLAVLAKLIDPLTFPFSSGARTFWFYLLGAFDLGAFVAHYLLHRVPILWEFHKVHHSAEVLTPITIYRFHPIDDSVSAVCTAACVGVVAGIFQWAFSAPVNEVVALGFNLGLFLYFLLGYNLRHSHVWLAYPRWLAWFLISPAQHQIHHSADPKHFHRNFGFAFSFWDRMAKTLYVPVDRESLEFGLGNGEDREYQRVTALYLVPFKKAARLFSGFK